MKGFGERIINLTKRTSVYFKKLAVNCIVYYESVSRRVKPLCCTFVVSCYNICQLVLSFKTCWKLSFRARQTLSHNLIINISYSRSMRTSTGHFEWPF